MEKRVSAAAALALLIFLIHQSNCYEKTLRKIVRDQSKMVQKPFSVSGVGDMVWKNSSLLSSRTDSKVYRHNHGPNTSKLSFSPMRLGNKELLTSDRLIRASNKNVSTVSDNSIYAKPFYGGEDNSFHDSDSQDWYIQSSKSKSNVVEDVNKVLVGIVDKVNSSIKLKSVPEEVLIRPIEIPKPVTKSVVLLEDVEKEVESEGGAADRYSFNKSVSPYACVLVEEAAADIDAQDKFSHLNIEPQWSFKKTYWNHVFDGRYESLMRDPKWPQLKVILVPRSHVDSIWRRTFEQYHHDSVHKILSNVVKKLQFYSNLTFSWNEVSHLSQWWATTSQKNRASFRRLVKSGRLEITTGFWVEPDEATSHIFELVHLIIEGHQWLKRHLNITPKVGWLTNSVAHSPTVTYLLAACGVHYLVFTNLHFALEKHFAEFQYSDFIWLQNWDSDQSDSILNERLNKIGRNRLTRSAVLTHYLQFNEAGFGGCGPNRSLCLADFNFAKTNRNLFVHNHNEKDKAELLLEQYSKTGTITPHNVIIAPLGAPYSYESQAEVDYQYNNYLRLADYINAHGDLYKASINFGTVKDYFNTILSNHKTYPTLKGDFLNFADLESGSPGYWAGYFTTRPLLKLLLRRLHSTLRTTEILFSFALTYNSFEGVNVTSVTKLLEKARMIVARLSDRNVGSGTLTVNALRYVHTQILNTVKDCWYIQEVAASLLTIKSGQNKPYLQKYVYRDGEFVSGFRSVAPGDQIYMFNSLSHERTEIVELVTKHPNIRIVNHKRKEVTLQVNPTWKYNAENEVEISNKYFKVVFLIVVPPLTLELYRVSESFGAAAAAAAVYCGACAPEPAASAALPFALQPLEPGDIQIESYKYRLIFDEFSGFLKSVLEKDTNRESTLTIDYGAFRSSDRNAGMYLFKTNYSKPLYDTFKTRKADILMIITGQVTTEVTSVHGRLLLHTVKIFNLLNCPLSSAIYIESKVDYETSPKNREMELFLSIQTDISNGDPPEIVTDNNGFQYTARLLNLSRGIESNMYPWTSLAFIEDRSARVTLAGERAGGVAALREGHLLVTLDRRVLYDDGRGAGEGLADSRRATHRHYLLLETRDPRHRISRAPASRTLNLPSMTALQLANSLTYLLDVFIIDKNATVFPYYTFFPLINVPFPCDVAVVNFRAVFRQGAQRRAMPNTALLVLHRQSFACDISYVAPHCNGNTKFSVEKIMRNIKSVFVTNLCGTNKGILVNKLNHVNFPPMELATFRLHF